MKKTIWILWGIAVGITALLFYFQRTGDKYEWDETACTALSEALNVSLQKAGAPQELVQHWTKEYSLQDSIPRKVTICSEKGTREFPVDSCKHVHNATTDPLQRQITSMLLEKKPLDSDSLNGHWQHLLVNQYNIKAETGIRISVTGWDDCVTTTTAGISPSTSFVDSLPPLYLGYRCEIEVVPFVRYSLWRNAGWFVFTPVLIVILLSLLFIFFWDKIVSVRLISKEEITVLEQKAIAVSQVVDTPHVVYMLGNVRFDSNSLLLWTEEHQVKLSPQTGLLLKKLILAPEHRVTTCELLATLWTDKSGTTQRLQQAVARLRVFLSEVSDFTVVLRDECYVLHLPYSIKTITA